MWAKTSNLSHLLFRNLDLRFFRWQAPRWECDTCKLHLCAFLRRQAPRWVWQLKAGPSLPFFLRWQAPRWKCDSCKLDIFDIFPVAGSQMKMLQLQSWLSLHFPGQTVENKKWHLTKNECGQKNPSKTIENKKWHPTKRTAHKRTVPNS